MCGIAGFWQSDGFPDPAVAERMALQIRHRGPDDAGVWIDEEAGLALAHRRLSILDLSPAGRQPMTSPCGRFTLIFNGEIYNHAEVRRDLEQVGGHFAWRGHSDTETLLAALRHWPLEDALARLNGMFAFALWDCSDRTLFLARDRLGEKPLYYGHVGGTFMFASELKSLTVHPQWRGDIDRSALTLFMRHSYVPTPWSIHEGIRKLPPAHFVTVSEGGGKVGEPECYWDLASIAERGASNRDVSSADRIDELDRLLVDAVGSRMTADVPLGAFLSGGCDSATIVAHMQAQSMRPVKTFSIGFHDKAYDEARHAKAVAAHLGTEHTDLYLTPSDVIDAIPALPRVWDEPFSDSSQIPTYLLSRLTREHVTVALSGDGGDELFYGYDRYRLATHVWNRLRLLPPRLRRAVGRLLAPGQRQHGDQRRPKQWTEPWGGQLGARVARYAELVSHPDDLSFYRDVVSHWKWPAELVIGGHEPATLLQRKDLLAWLPGLQERMMYVDTRMYLPDDILTKVDRATMAAGLEARVPLLDHRVVEFAWGLPMSLKLRDGETKWLLRQVLDRYVPRHLTDRPKMGFRLPIQEWLRGPLRDWAEELLGETRLRNEGFLDPRPVRRMWDEHMSGQRQRHYYLWDVLMFQSWLENQKRGPELATDFQPGLRAAGTS